MRKVYALEKTGISFIARRHEHPSLGMRNYGNTTGSEEFQELNVEGEHRGKRGRVHEAGIA